MMHSLYMNSNYFDNVADLYFLRYFHLELYLMNNSPRLDDSFLPLMDEM